MPYKLRVLRSTSKLLELPPVLCYSLGIHQHCIRKVSFGMRMVDAVVGPSKAYTGEVVYASLSLLRALSVPSDVHWQLVGTDDGLVLGPFIGLLISRHADALFERRLRRLLPEVKAFSEHGGIVTAFSLDHVNRKSLTVNGFVYQLNSGTWMQVESAYPAAIYRRIGLSATWREHFNSATEQRLFNSYFWNKWELYQWASQNAALASHVPETEFVSTWRDVLRMVDLFGAAFVKPVAGMRGAAALMVQQHPDRRLLVRTDAGESRLLDRIQAMDIITNHCRNRRFIVQRYIPLLSWHRSVVDFRVLMQKDDTLQWSCQGIIARVGSPGSIVSNISRNGLAYPMGRFLQMVRPELGKSVENWEELMKLAAMSVCRLLDQQRLNNGTLGLDIGIDRTGNWWLIEANSRDPAPSIALDAGNRELYATLRLNPLRYAAGLAGFTRRQA